MPYAHRPYHDGDLAALVDLAARARSADVPGMHAGDIHWRLYYIPSGVPRSEVAHVWHDERGRLAGFSLLSEDAFEFQTVRELRGTPLDDEIVDWSAADIRAWRRTQGVDDHCAVDLRERDAVRRETLERRGMTGRVTGVCFERTLDDAIPAPSTPAGYGLRGVRGIDDAQARATATSRRSRRAAG